MVQRHALLIPVICPLDENSVVGSSVHDLAIYSEIKHLARYRLVGDIFNFYEKKRRIKAGSFAPLRDRFEGHDIVFLHPFEVLRTLSARVIVSESENVDIVRLDSLRASKDLEEYLSELWYRGNAVIVSNYLVEAIVDNLTVQYRRVLVYEHAYCYGRIKRVVRKLSVKNVLENSGLAATLPTHGSNMEKAEIVYESLNATPTYWPWVVLGLVIDRARSWIAVLNPDTASLIEVGDVEELRKLEYGGRKIPVIVVKKLTLTRRCEKELIGSQNRLDELLLRVVTIHSPIKRFPS
jgi:hypothetical protein